MRGWYESARTESWSEIARSHVAFPLGHHGSPVSGVLCGYGTGTSDG